MDRLGTIYGKPVTKGLAADPRKILSSLKNEVLKKLKAKLIQTTFSERAKKALAASLRVKIGPSSLTIETNHPAFITLIKGQRRGQMTWLTKAKAPIPIITDTGQLIFRSATPRSMANGKWVHPGRKPQDFVEKAKEEAKALVKARLVKELRNMAKSVRGKR